MPESRPYGGAKTGGRQMLMVVWVWGNSASQSQPALLGRPAEQTQTNQANQKRVNMVPAWGFVKAMRTLCPAPWSREIGVVEQGGCFGTWDTCYPLLLLSIFDRRWVVLTNDEGPSRLGKHSSACRSRLQGAEQRPQIRLEEPFVGRGETTACRACRPASET
ncbi:hypothetical protein F5B21DRAFT_415881 [Xylaria acuta]|nr:hypothetical protein F5B21DRAFT_415881 [Xylaria acuta]